MKLLLDTNAYSDWRRNGLWNEAISHADHVLMTTIVLGELQAGFRMGKSRSGEAGQANRFSLGAPSFVVSPSERTAEIYGEFVAQLRRQGTPLPSNDIWIAAPGL